MIDRSDESDDECADGQFEIVIEALSGVRAFGSFGMSPNVCCKLWKVLGKSKYVSALGETEVATGERDGRVAFESPRCDLSAFEDDARFLIDDLRWLGGAVDDEAVIVLIEVGLAVAYL